jgi:hypothetical protein
MEDEWRIKKEVVMAYYPDIYLAAPRKIMKKKIIQ